jgi:hypothetical protein
MTDNSHSNRRSDNARRRPNTHTETVRKVPADSVPYGTSISRNGRTVWAAFDGETVIAVAATVDEARAKYRTAQRVKERERLTAMGKA